MLQRLRLFFNPFHLAVIVLLAGCAEKKDFTVISDLELGENKDNHPTIRSLQKALEPIDVRLAFKDARIDKEADIIKLIDEGVIDIGIVKNDVEIKSGYKNVRTLLPLFPDVMLILARDTSSTTIQEVFQRNKAAVVLDKIEENNVIQNFLKKSGVSGTSLPQVHASDSAGLIEALNEYDVLVLFASLNSQSVRNILRTWNGTIFSLDEPALMGKGSIVDGFCMSYPKAVPFIIPKGTYGKWPLQPVLTFAVYDVMVCHQDLEEHMAYDFLKQIYDMRQSLSEDNFEFGLLDDNIESHKFSFPLHEGAVKYMTRDQPTFWERESEVLGLLISILVLTSGGVTTLIKYLKQRRKDRVDTYYQKVLFASNQARATDNPLKKQEYLKELYLIRNNAFEQLIAENLDANEAFTIFVNLLNATIQEIEAEIRVDSSSTVTR